MKDEARIAKRLGGRVYKRSGGMSWSRHDVTTMRGDLSTPDLHIEHKRIEPTTKSISVKRMWLSKVTAGARRVMKIPAMVFHFEEAQGHDEDWILLPLDVVERLFTVLKDE